MKPYSLDLRQKIIETYEQEAISQRNLAKRFRVALSPHSALHFVVRTQV